MQRTAVPVSVMHWRLRHRAIGAILGILLASPSTAFAGPAEPQPAGSEPEAELQAPPEGTAEAAPESETTEPDTEPDGESDGEPTTRSESGEATSPEPQDPLRGAAGLDPQGLVDAEQRAYSDYMIGMKHYEEGRFAEAAAAFEGALRTLPDAPPYGRSRGALGLWLARSIGRQYGLTGEPSLLDREEDLLLAYQARLQEVAVDNADQRHKHELAQQRLDEIAAEKERLHGDHGDVDTQLARSMRGDYDGVSDSRWAPAPDDLAFRFRPDDPRPRSRQQLDREAAPEELEAADDDARRRPGTGLIAGGAVAMVFGVAGLGVMGAGMARASAAEDFDPLDDPQTRREQLDRGQSGNTMSVVGASVGGALLLTGVVMIAVGVKRRRRSVQTTLSWGVAPGAVQLGIAGRF